MGMKLLRSDFHVQVYPRSPGDAGVIIMSGVPQTEAEAESAAQELLDDILKHVDRSLVPSCGAKGRVVWDSDYVCEHCGGCWTEAKDSPHNGGCCDEDCALMETPHD